MIRLLKSLLSCWQYHLGQHMKGMRLSEGCHYWSMRSPVIICLKAFKHSDEHGLRKETNTGVSLYINSHQQPISFGV